MQNLERFLNRFVDWSLRWILWTLAGASLACLVVNASTQNLQLANLNLICLAVVAGFLYIGGKGEER
jgi:hypothetical protein